MSRTEIRSKHAPYYVGTSTIASEGCTFSHDGIKTLDHRSTTVRITRSPARTTTVRMCTVVTWVKPFLRATVNLRLLLAREDSSTVVWHLLVQFIASDLSWLVGSQARQQVHAGTWKRELTTR